MWLIPSTKEVIRQCQQTEGEGREGYGEACFYTVRGLTVHDLDRGDWKMIKLLAQKTHL